MKTDRNRVRETLVQWYKTVKDRYSSVRNGVINLHFRIIRRNKDGTSEHILDSFCGKASGKELTEFYNAVSIDGSEHRILRVKAIRDVVGVQAGRFYIMLACDVPDILTDFSESYGNLRRG